MEKSFSQKLIRGSLLRVIRLICNLIISFFMMPFLIRSLGDRWYGFWTLAGSIIGYYGFLDLGLSSAVSRFVSRAYGQKDYHEMNVVVNTAGLILSTMGLGVLIISGLLALSSPLFIESPSEAQTFRFVILILGAGFAISFPMKIIVGLLTSYIRYDLLTYVELLKLFVQTGSVFYLVSLGYGIKSLALVTFTVQLLGHAINFYWVKRSIPSLKLGRHLLQKDRLRSLLNYSSFSFLSQLADLLRFRVDASVIAIFLRVDSITPYFIAVQLVEYFMRFITSAVGIMTPVFSQLEGRKDFKILHKMFFDATRISTGLAGFIGISLIIYGKPFIERWMGVDYFISYKLLLILCLPFTVALMQNPSVALLFGTSKHRYYAYFNIIEGLLNLIISLILVQYYGLFGVALGTAIPMFFIKLFIQPLYVCRVNGISWRMYFLETLGFTAGKTLFPVIIYWLFIRKYLNADYVNILFIASIQTLLFIPVFIFGILSQEQRKKMFDSLGLSRRSRSE